MARAKTTNKWIILALLALAQFMVVLDVSVVNVALPSLARELNFAANNLQWVITAYALTFGGFLLLGGRTADVFGRRKLFIAAITMFAVTSLVCGLSQSSTMLIMARGVQGFTAAFMAPTALSIVLTEFKEGKDRNRALGVWAAVASSGAAVGVLLGGILTEYFGWRWNFFINVPVGLLVAIASYTLLPDHLNEEKKGLKLDHFGASTATAGLVSLVYGLSKAPVDGWGSTTVIGFLALSLVLLVAFLFNESRTSHPLMPLSFFKTRSVSGGNLTALIIAASLFSMFFFMTLYIQTVLGYSPIKTGVSFLITPFVVGAFSGITAQLVNKIGFKPTLVIGPFLLAVGLLLLATMRVSGTYWHDVFPGLVVTGMGLGFSFVSLTLAATSGVPGHFAGLASGILNTAQQVGGALGLAVLSAVASSATRAATAHGTSVLQARVNGFHDALHVGMGFALAASIIALLMVKNQKVKAGPEMAA